MYVAPVAPRSTHFQKFAQEGQYRKKFKKRVLRGATGATLCEINIQLNILVLL